MAYFDRKSPGAVFKISRYREYEQNPIPFLEAMLVEQILGLHDLHSDNICLLYSKPDNSPDDFKPLKLIDFASPRWNSWTFPIRQNPKNLQWFFLESLVILGNVIDPAKLDEAWNNLCTKLKNLPEPVVRFFVYPPLPDGRSLFDLLTVDFCSTSGGLNLATFMSNLDTKYRTLYFERFPDHHVFAGRSFADLLSFTNPYDNGVCKMTPN
jgi:hypothetical protein